MQKIKSNKIIDLKVQKIYERSTKPPGTAKFYRTKPDSEKDGKIYFENDNFNISVLCQQLLVGGFVQSYVDFYQLTHRVDPTTIQDMGMSQIQISNEDTIFIRDNLVKAEVSRRQGDTVSVYAAYNQLADYYVKKQDWQTSLFFHEKCLEVSQLTNDVRAEMSANNALGIIYQLMFEHNKALSYHERHEEIANSLDIFEEVAKSNVELYKVYLHLAEKANSQNKLDVSLEFYNKCLEAAKKSWDKSSEAEANGKIGSLLLNRGEAQQSLYFLRQQSQLSADLGNAEGRCRACSALALALDSMGQSEKALHELQMVVSVSDQVGDAYLQAQACRGLGILLSKLGRLEEAVEVLQRHFNLLKKILSKPKSTISGEAGDSSAAAAVLPIVHIVSTQDLDMARAYIGISKGNLLMGKYVATLQSNLSMLLDWKLNRTDIVISREINNSNNDDENKDISELVHNLNINNDTNDETTSSNNIQ